jgi:outer membrane receptor protein involved in Fe transport
MVNHNLRRDTSRRYWLVTVSFGALTSIGATPALAQVQPAAPQQQVAPTSQSANSAVGEQIVVTGSRIRGSSDTKAAAPVAQLDAKIISQKGYAQVGDLLKELPSNSTLPVLQPSSQGTNFSATSGASSNSVIGQDYPNLFSLGPQRTLSLLNGRRLPSTSNGLELEATDSNIIPTGLLERVDVVQGGGASVYGSGAIAGVVNYIFRQNYSGLDLQAQYRAATRGGYEGPILRATAGLNFGRGRGNVAGELDYSKTSALTNADRWGLFPRIGSLTGIIPNPAPGAGTNGIPATIFTDQFTHVLVAQNGVVLNSPTTLLPNQAPQINGLNITIDSSGNIVPQDMGVPSLSPGTLVGGGDEIGSFPYIQSLYAAVERKVANLIGHYDLTDHVKVYGEFVGARVKTTDPKYDTLVTTYQPTYCFFPRLCPIPFTRDNAYLSAATVAQLSALSPAFASGQPLYLSKAFINQDSKYSDRRFTTETLRGLIGLSGDFTAIKRHFFWDVAYSRSRVKQTPDAFHMAFPNFTNARNAVRNSAGQIVCAINNPVVTDPACVPINIFGRAPLDPAAEAYIYRPSGGVVVNSIGAALNKQQDLLATLSGDLVPLPGGDAKFSVSYERRKESASFTPFPGDEAAIFAVGAPVHPASGHYSTNEFAAEINVPLLGHSFSLPLVQSFDFHGSYRYVDNSLAGKNSVWGAEVRWGVGGGLQLRGTRSRNFRAPTIAQVAAPTTLSFGSVNPNPCNRTAVAAGPAPATRAANGLTLFTNNPTFGLNLLPVGVPNTPQNRLANFLQGGVATVQVQGGGNPDLTNEVSDTTTLGAVYQPTFVPGLSISADVLRLKLKGALVLFSPTDFANACFDATPQPAVFCDRLSFDANGNVSRSAQQTVNAGSFKMRAQIFNVDYRLPLNRLSAHLAGTLNLVVQATHNSLQTITVGGTTTRTDGTIALPKWSARFDARYRNGPFGLFYSMRYLPSSLLSRTATVENSINGITRVDANMTHDIAAEYTFRDRYTLRLGVNNVFDRMPSYPTINYGSIIGRTVFASIELRPFGQ